MKLAQLTYLLSIVIFAGSAMLAVWVKYKKILRKYEMLLLVVVSLFIPFAAVEYFALKWGAWSYNPDKTSNVYFGSALETYIFAICVALVLGAVTVVHATVHDKRLKARKQSRRSHS